MYNYPYKGFVIFIRPTEFAKFGDRNWQPDKATPVSWGYRIDKMPGKLGISKGDDYESKEIAEAAAEERIESWN